MFTIKTRKKFTRDFKISILRELKAVKNIAQVSRENNLHPTLIYRWIREYKKSRITKSLFQANRKKVRRPMKENNLIYVKKRFKMQTTDSNHVKKVYQNLAKNLKVTDINQLLCSLSDC